MRTTKPISTISFNSANFLELKLNELLKAGRISFWAFIPHLPEDDEAGNKEHHHVYIEPAKMLQTDDIRAELREYDPTHPDKPKGTLTFKSSNFDHWYLYGLHDKKYLASKGQSRKYHYSHSQMISSDADDLLCKARCIDMMSLTPYADIEDAIHNGISFQEYFRRGTIPLPQLALWQRAWDLLSRAMTERGAYKPHWILDPETGEVIDPTKPKESPQTPSETPLPKTKSADVLRYEVVTGQPWPYAGMDKPGPLSPDEPPQGNYTEIGTDDELPW